MWRGLIDSIDSIWTIDSIARQTKFTQTITITPPMRIKISILLPIALVLVAFTACKNDAPAASKAPAEPETIQLAPVSAEGAVAYSVVEGTVEWTGSKTVSKSNHQGTITVESGEVLVKDGQLLSGKVVLNMNSITVLDIKDPGERRDLESHLKDADFFEVGKFPKAEFVFTEVLPNTMPNYNWVLSGNLSMKGKTAPVNIPVKISFEGDVMRAESPAFPINRTQWGVNFQSGMLGTVKDK